MVSPIRKMNETSTLYFNDISDFKHSSHRGPMKLQVKTPFLP